MNRLNTYTCVGNNLRRISSAVAPSLLSVDVYKTTDHRANDSILPRVYLLNQQKDTSVPLQEALRSLRAYSLTEKTETVEINLKCNMKLKMVSTIISNRQRRSRTSRCITHTYC